MNIRPYLIQIVTQTNSAGHSYNFRIDLIKAYITYCRFFFYTKLKKFS